MKRMKQWLLIGLLGLGGTAPACGTGRAPVDVVASFSVLADMVRQVGGEYVDVTTLVGRNSDAHSWSPTPAAARAVATADLVVVNGLGFEGWLDRLIEASGYDGPVLVASRGVDALPASAGAHGHEHGDEHGHGASHWHGHSQGPESQQKHKHRGHSEEPSETGTGKHHEHSGDHHHRGAYDPHAWQDASNGAIYVHNIADALSRVDPAHADAYHARAEAYTDRLMALHARIKAMIAALPEDRRTVVVPHHAYRYFANAYGVRFLAPIGLSTASAASAGEKAALIREIRAKGIDAIFTENITDPRLLRQIARETGATIRGTLYSDALSSADGPAGTYIEMLRYNATQIANALRRDGSRR